jgi:hypothetical protein
LILNKEIYMSRFFIVTLLGLAASSIMAFGDMTVKTHTVVTEDGKTHEGTRYLYYRRGTMRRRDSIDSKGASSIITIANCETKSGFLINPIAREYRTYKVVKFFSDAQLAAYLKEHPGNAVPVESHTVDTGERKTFFGHPAKHFITTIKRPRSKDNGGGEESIDGWYIDHERPDNNCAPDYTANQLSYWLPTGLVTYPDVPQFRHTGPLPAGLAVKLIHTIKFVGSESNAADQTFATEETVEDLVDSSVQPSLFELPSGFHENSQLFRK